MNRFEEYLDFVNSTPALFVNPPDCGITILLNEDEISLVETEVERKLEAQGMPIEWAQVGIAYHDQYFRILRDAVRLSNGGLDIYTRYMGSEDGVPGTFVLPRYQGQILLVRHFRHDSRTFHLEIPGGFGTKGMSSEENARKELNEEIKATVSRLIPLGHVNPDLYSSSDCVAIFYADIESYGDIEAHEGISELSLATVSEFEQMIYENKITDMFTIVAYTRAKLQGLL